MSEFKDTIPCPVCKLEVDPQVEFCPACGYKEPAKPPIDYQQIQDTQLRVKESLREFARKAIGPFNFAFPEVQSAYVFHQANKASTRSILIMLGLGLLAAIAGGLLLYQLHRFVAYAISVLLANRSFCLGITGLVSYPLAAALIGYLVAQMVNQAAILSQCRDTKTAKVIGLLAGLVAFAAYVVVYIKVLGVIESFDSWIDFLKLGSYLLILPGMTWYSVGKTIEGTPFCEKCNRFMKAKPLGGNANYCWPIGYESHLLEIFQNHNYSELLHLPLEKTQNGSSLVIATVWYCSKCRDNGYINLRTVQVRRRYENNKETFEQQKRLVYSAQMNHEQISELLAISDKIQLPPKTK